MKKKVSGLMLITQCLFNSNSALSKKELGAIMPLSCHLIRTSIFRLTTLGYVDVDKTTSRLKKYSLNDKGRSAFMSGKNITRIAKVEARKTVTVKSEGGKDVCLDLMCFFATITQKRTPVLSVNY